MAKAKAQKGVTYSSIQMAALMDAFGKSYRTIERWIAKGDDRLTSEKAKEALKKVKG